MSAAALLSLGLASCSSNDEANENPTFDGKAVKTTFSISLPGNVAKTRMAGKTVQVAEDIATFRGMSNIVIIPFSHTTDRAARLGDNITLGENKMVVPTTTNDANAIPEGKLLANNNAVLYNDVSIPVGTSAFLFYGKAKGTDGYADGYLTPTPADLTGETSGIFFNPTQIQATPTTTVGEKLAAYVTAIAAAKVGDDATDGAWWKCTNPANSTQTWYNAGLGDMYRSFTSLKAGASTYVQAAVQDLYKSILTNTNPVAAAIRAAIETKVTSVATDGTLTFNPELNGYPGTDNNSMPDGCAALTWANVPAATDPATQAATATAVTNSTFGGYGNTLTPAQTQAMDKIVYPASLYYFVDSPVKTSVASRQADYKATNDDSSIRTWDQILDKYTDGQSVTTTTRSVAITKPIQYAVGRLDLTVSKLDKPKYYDRRGEEVTIPATGFQLTGVLIGGQKKVDYKFNQVSSSTDEYAIYDKTINTESASDKVSTTVDAGTNYTLALETAETQKVHVALEFLNNSGKDFIGVDGVVKDGCKFYMIAQLDPTTGTKPTGYVGGDKVFVQDYKTIANFSFGTGTADTNHDGVADTPGGFGNAYVTIPDLRTPKLELGFSVDLHWQEGITFTHEF